MNSYVAPTAVEAQIFAELVEAGVPVTSAVLIASPTVDGVVAAEVGARWERDAAVRVCQVQMMGADWRKLGVNERMVYALRRHYNQVAYFVATTNWGEATAALLSKLNTGREALEKKLAGTAGAIDPAAQFWADALAGKVKLPGVTKKKDPEAVQ